MIVLLLLLLPLFSSLVIMTGKTTAAKKLALLFSVAELLITLYSYTLVYLQPSSALLRFNVPWVASLGISFNLALDGISMVLILLSNILVPVIVLSATDREIKNANAFYSLILFMQMALAGVFIAMDGFLFYIFWELALIPVYFICLLWGGEGRARITFKFFVYTLAGSLFMLAGLISLYLHTAGPVHSFDINTLYKAGQSMDSRTQGFVFLSIFLAFAVKMPVFPFHSWQPDTYTTAPAQGTMLLSGIMLKMGTYGLLRWLMPMVPLGIAEWGPAVIVLSVTGIIYASCIALVQKDFKRLFAWSSIAHVGLISAGILAFNVQGMQGALVQMFSHGVIIVGLFFIADRIELRMHTRDIAGLGGIRTAAPGFALFFLLVLLGSVALPLTSGFTGEFLLLTGIFRYSAWTAAFAGLGVILGAIYMFRAYQRSMLGEPNSISTKFTELSGLEKAVLVPLIVLIIGLGIYPKPILKITEPAIQTLISNAVIFKP